MALRYWPETWGEAAEWCFVNGLEKEGNEFLTQGISANTAEWAVRLSNRLGARTVLFGEFIWDNHHDVLAIQRLT